MAGRHNGCGCSSFDGQGHFGGRVGGSHSNPTESFHAYTAYYSVPVPLTCMLNAWGHSTHPSGWGTVVPPANPTENTSDQEISCTFDTLFDGKLKFYLHKQVHLLGIIVKFHSLSSTSISSLSYSYRSFQN
jgi:hypothetical protein